MVICSKRTGYASSSGMINYVTFWGKEMTVDSPMRFLDNKIDSSLVTDIYMEKGNIYVCSYPHNKESIFPGALEREEELLEIYARAKESFPHRQEFTIIMDKKIRLITEMDFFNYAPNTKDGDELFVFEQMFPEILVVDRTQRKSHPETLHVMSRISQTAFSLASAPTELGKQFTYFLANSAIHGEPRLETSGVISMKFPTKGSTRIPTYLNLTALRKFCNGTGSNTITVGKDGKTSVNDNTSEGMVKQALFIIVQQQIIEGTEINFTDMYDLGLSQVMSVVPISDKIIPIHLDVSEVGKKACIFQGQIHIIPCNNDFDPQDEFGEPLELFHLCTEDTFPKKPATKIS